MERYLPTVFTLVLFLFLSDTSPHNSILLPLYLNGLGTFNFLPTPAVEEKF